MSDPKREDLRRKVDSGLARITDAEFEAIVDADPRWVRRAVLQAVESRLGGYHERERGFRLRLAEWERLGVKVWEDCPNQCDQGVVLTDVCGCGRINHAEHFEERECADCGGSGKVPAEGVEPFFQCCDECRQANPTKLVVEASDDE